MTAITELRKMLCDVLPHERIRGVIVIGPRFAARLENDMAERSAQQGEYHLPPELNRDHGTLMGYPFRIEGSPDGCRFEPMQ